METNPSRTAERAERVRLDDVVVEFTAGSADDCFEADAINVSSGGIALRSPLLPEVGTRLACRFPNPLDGELIRAECEVVWASDHGPNLGEFGLRFERLSAESAESLRKLVEDDDRMLTADEAAELGWTAPPPVVEATESDAESDEIEGPEIIGLELEGVASELLAEVRHDSDDVLVAEQELPFLRLGKRVTTEDGRTGMLQTVELRLEGDMPRLVFTVVYDSAATADDDADPLESSEDEAFADRPTLVLAESNALARDEGGDSDEDSGEFAAGYDDSLDDDTIPDDVHAPVSIRAARPKLAEQVRAAGEPVALRATEVAGAVRDATVDRLSAAIPAVRSRLEDARESVTAVASDVAPKVKDGLKELGARASRFGRLLAQKLRAEAEAADEGPKKRVQRRPDGRVVAAPVAEPRKLRGRHLLLGLLGLFVAVLAIRGIVLATGDEVPPPAPLAPAVAPEESLDIAPPPAPAAAATVTPPPIAPAVTPGPIPEPTYPSLDRAAEAATPSATASAERPRLDYGAASVPGATPFELTMTTPIDRIEGETTETGFEIRILRSNSLSRAGPIAQQHTAVDRASITNNGENAVLRIDWKPGRRPPFRVEAVGNRLRILLGR